MNSRASIFLFVAYALCAMVPVVSGQSVIAAVPTSVSVGLTQDQLLAELTRQLSDHFQVRGELQLELYRPWTSPTGTSSSVEPVIIDWPTRLASSLSLAVRLQNGGAAVAQFTLLVKVQLLREVWVARTPIERGSNFDPSQLDTRKVDVLLQRETVATDSTEADLTYACSVAAGRPLCWRDLTHRSLIRKGQIVEVAAIDGTLTITTKALAMENGAAGDTVKLRNLESKKDFSALVVAEARAQVRF
jgi:flagella basal body P-ring formation protein FlgA